MTWDVERARRSNRRWMLLAAVLGLVPVLIVAAVATMPYWWSRAAWSQKLVTARSVHDYAAIPADASYDDVVAKLGPPLYSGPGFESDDDVIAGVYYWGSDAGEIRGLVIRGRLVGRLKQGVW